MSVINSVNNPKIKQYSKLLVKKYRDQAHQFLVEGPHLVEEAQKAQLVIEVLTTNPMIGGTLVSQQVLEKLTTTNTPQNVVAICKKPSKQKLGAKILVLSDIQDPGNVGTLIRSAAAFGYDGVLVSGCDVYNPKVIRASQGAIFMINVIQTQDVSQYFENYHTIGAVVDQSAVTYDKIQAHSPFMLVLGNEGQGLSKAIINQLDYKVYIPVHFESLNVASAGAILLNYFQPNLSDGMGLFDL